MKFTKKLPTTDKELSIKLYEAGWIKIKEPRNLFWAVLFSFPLALCLGAMTSYAAYLLKPLLFSFITSDSLEISFNIDWKFLLFIISIWGYMLIHEMVHAVLIPHFRTSERTKWGLNGIFGFVFTTEPIKKECFILISCMPFVLLSIVSLLLFEILGVLNGYTFVLCLINAMGSCVDFLNIIIILFQVKRGCIIISNGFETFYKERT